MKNWVFNMASMNEIKKSEKEVYSDLLIELAVNWVSFPITKLFAKTKLSANAISIISLLVGLTAGVFLGIGDTTYSIVGGVLVYFSIVIDACDGKIARLRGTCSRFGAIIDEWCDRFREYAFFIGITLGVYRMTGLVHVLIVGMIALSNFEFLHSTRYLVNLNYKRKVREAKFMFRGKSYNFYFSSFTYFVIIFVSIFNYGYYFLWVYATLGVLPWLKKILSAYKLHKTDKQLQEKIDWH